MRKVLNVILGVAVYAALMYAEKFDADVRQAKAGAYTPVSASMEEVPPSVGATDDACPCIVQNGYCACGTGVVVTRAPRVVTRSIVVTRAPRVVTRVYSQPVVYGTAVYGSGGYVQGGYGGALLNLRARRLARIESNCGPRSRFAARRLGRMNARRGY